DEHLRHEEVALLEAPAHLVERGDEGLEEDVHGVHAQLQPFFGESLDLGRMSIERVVEQAGSDLFFSTHLASSLLRIAQLMLRVQQEYPYRIVLRSEQRHSGGGRDPLGRSGRRHPRSARFLGRPRVVGSRRFRGTFRRRGGTGSRRASLDRPPPARHPRAPCPGGAGPAHGQIPPPAPSPSASACSRVPWSRARHGRSSTWRSWRSSSAPRTRPATRALSRSSRSALTPSPRRSSRLTGMSSRPSTSRGLRIASRPE